MLIKIKEYKDYLKNKRIAKKELAMIMAALLPAIRRTSDKSTDIAEFFIRLANAAKDIDGERLLALLLNEISNTLQTDNSRLLEILTYMAGLSPEDIRKILVHSMVESMPAKDNAI